MMTQRRIILCHSSPTNCHMMKGMVYRYVYIYLVLLVITPQLNALPRKSILTKNPSSSRLLLLSSRGGSSSPPPSYNDDYPGNHQETVQSRVDAWRQEQQSKYAHMTPAQESNPRDEDGRIKLLASVSRGSRAIIFFILMWRDVHLYEVADQAFVGFKRLCFVTPLTILFIANMAGVVASFTAPTHSAKKRLKAILNLNKLVEFLLILHNFVRLTFLPSKYIPREIYIANTLYSVFIIVQSQAFTKVNWGENTLKSSTPTPPDPYASSYAAAPPDSSDFGYAESPPQQQQPPSSQQQQYYDARTTTAQQTYGR